MQKVPAISAKLQQKVYNEHRKRVHGAITRVDAGHPVLYLSKLFNVHHLKDDSAKYMAIARTNIDLLKKVDRYMRTRGCINTFQPLRTPDDSKKKKMILRMKAILEIEEKNLILAQRLLCAKAKLITRRPESNRRRCAYQNFQPPLHIIAKYDNLVLPRSKELQYKMLRPKIYIALAVKDVRPLGRLVMQLYTEASPQVVLEVVRTCVNQECSTITFVRLFPGLWLEGELKLNVDSLAAKTIEYDMRALDHGQCAGILSFSTEYLKGFRRGCLNFTISAKPLRVLNGQRVAFGRVTSGLKIIDCLQDYGTKNGKPKKQIIVTDCGLYQ